MERLSRAFTCPACEAALEHGLWDPGSAISCPSCDHTFPKLGQIPVLLPDPRATLERWRARLSAFGRETEAIERHLWAELASSDLAAATRKRLRSVAEAMPDHRALVQSLFRQVGLEPDPSPPADDAGSPLDYVTLIHRDFGWAPDVDEVAPAFARLRSVLPNDFRLGATLVFGAGTARLAWDLAQLDPSAEVVALDTNPLPFLVTQELLSRRDVDLYELPGHPRRAEDAAVRRTLRAPQPSATNLRLLLADGLRVPVRPGSFDTVVTPWFVDQVPANLATFLPELSRVLRPGGAWLHTGPLVYDPARTRPAHRYGKAEFLELLPRAGFDVTAQDYAAAPYLCSPLSTQGRLEWVLTLHAVKRVELTPSAEPAWLGPGSTDPIPRLEFAPDTEWPLPMLQRVLGLADGQQSAQDIALVLVAAGELADDGNAEAVVRGCLRILWKATSSGSER